MKPIRAWVQALLGVSLVAASACAQPGVAKGSGTRPESPAPLISILCYHDISNDTRRGETVPASFLRAQIRSAKASGWTFLSLSELLAARDEPGRLPPRTLVLTFDDGYRSFYDEALPILRDEGVKATLAVVGTYVENPPADLPPMMTWDQIREAEASGWVEIASHSYDLHHWASDNPWHDTAPSVTARVYQHHESRYESRDEYLARIRDDLVRSQRALTQQLGHPVSALAWPFGEHNRAAREIAAAAGFTVTLALGQREVTPTDLEAGWLPRLMVTRTMNFSTHAPLWAREPTGVTRAVQVDIDDLYDADEHTFRDRVDRMILRARAAGATHVILQSCPDPNGDARFTETWFMNHQAPVRADVLSMIAHKLKHARMRVWVRAPTMNLPWAWEQHPEWRIPWHQGRVRGEATPWYFRLSPNLPEARTAAVDFFTDLAVYVPIEGILFDDDAYMLRGESLQGSGRSSPAEKAAAIRELHEEIRQAVRAWRPECRFARNVYAPVVERRGVHPGFSQDYTQCLKDYDLTVVMAYAHMEGHGETADVWIASLARHAQRPWKPTRDFAGRATPLPVMFKLQSYDWNREEWVSENELRALAWEAYRAGVVHLGIYPFPPDDGEIPPRLLEGVAPERWVTSERESP